MLLILLVNLQYILGIVCVIIKMEISGESEHAVADSKANYQGAEILVGTWEPAVNIFETRLK